MKFPRDVAADRPVRAPSSASVEIVRLRPDGSPAHTITVPLHHRLKTDTPHGILCEVAKMRHITVESLAKLL